MAVLIRDYVRPINYNDAGVPLAKKLYVLPTNLDIHVQTLDTTWQAWTKNPGIAVDKFKLAIEVAVDANDGRFSLILPYTDTEVYRQAGGTTKWQIWDDDAGLYYQGSLSSGLWTVQPFEYSLKDLLSNPGSDWEVVIASAVVLGVTPGSVVTAVFIAVPGQTIFALPIVPAAVAVYRNGLRLRNAAGVSVDLFTQTGVNITTGTPCANGEVITVDYTVPV